MHHRPLLHKMEGPGGLFAFDDLEGLDVNRCFELAVTRVKMPRRVVVTTPADLDPDPHGSRCSARMTHRSEVSSRIGKKGAIFQRVKRDARPLRKVTRGGHPFTWRARGDKNFIYAYSLLGLSCIRCHRPRAS